MIGTFGHGVRAGGGRTLGPRRRETIAVSCCTSVRGSGLNTTDTY